MKIGLISPKSSFLSQNKKFTEFWSNSQFTEAYREEWSGLSVALCLLAALTPPEHEVEIIDENVEEINFSVKYDLIGITAMTQQALRAYEIAEEWRKRSTKVVLGGIHASLLPNEAIKHVDTVVIGEAENLWVEILNDCKNKKLKPFYESKTPTDVTDLPIPRYELLKGKPYKTHWIETTRGCPFDCVFCASPKIYGHKYRLKKVEQVIREIKYVKNLYPDTSITFSDDNMFINRKYSKELLKEISKLQIRYGAETDLSVAEDDELLSLIKESGCSRIFIGLESLTEEGINGIDKNNKKQRFLKKNSKYIEKIQSNGIGVVGSLIVGFDGDDLNVFDEIVEFSKKNFLYNTQVSILTPFPGTKIREKLLKENRILNTPWNNYTIFDVNIVHDKISQKDFEDGILKILKELNSNDFIMKKLVHFKNIQRELLKRKPKIAS